MKGVSYLDDKSREFLEGVYPYFRILETINDDYYDLIINHACREMYGNAEIIYRLLTNIVRVLPIRINKVKGSWLKDYKEIILDTQSGILLLRKYIPFLEKEYNEIIAPEKSKYVLSRAALIRNKYTHVPHCVHFCFSVGGKSSFSGGVWYGEELISVSTIQLSNIVCQLNVVFDRIRDLYISTVESFDPKYKKYPCYIRISGYQFKKLNERYGNMPWEWIETESDQEEYERLIDEILKEYSSC